MAKSVAGETTSVVFFSIQGEFWGSVYLKIDEAVLQPAGASLVEKVDVFNEQAEERDDDLEDSRERRKREI